MSYFHFTLGPVQGFVAQARRTRDFWAGSFILSWLSAVAMKAVEKQGGIIMFPKPDTGFMKAIETGCDGPKQGNIPNRFKASVNVAFVPKLVVDSVQIAWEALAEHIWKNDLADIAGNETHEIWNRQIRAFWDIQWALVKDIEASNTLDRMKNWRTYLPPDEPGVKCMMMDGWQELSGAARPGTEPEAFWKNLCESGKTGITTDLRPKEMLCAIGFVKRRFTRHFAKLLADMPGGWKLKGWELPSGVPSVHYMAAAPWLTQLIRKANQNSTLEDDMWKFHHDARKLTGEYGEWDTNIRSVKEAIEAKPGQHKWAALDGSIFFDAMLENENLWGEKAQAAKQLLERLKTVRKAADIAPVSAFYAVLLMDGDELGMHMSHRIKQQAITKGLAQFTEGVGAIVYQHNGFLIYAGGDDVLALLPLEEALNCAAALRKHYLGCFLLDDIPTSISAAIEYAHIKTPLGKVLHDAHDLLERVAKDGRGRDAVACRVWKPGGLVLQWAMPWEYALQDCNVILEVLAADFQKNQRTADADDDQDRFASKFFYRIRERFDLLNPEQKAPSPDPLPDPVLGPEQAVSLMAMEYLNSGTTTAKTMDAARTIVRPLLVQCRPVVRDKSKAKEEWTKSACLEADGALLVRFLAQKGVER